MTYAALLHDLTLVYRTRQLFPQRSLTAQLLDYLDWIEYETRHHA